MKEFLILIYTTKWRERDHVTMAVLEFGEKMVGTAMIDFYGEGKKHALFWNLHVDPECRRLGIATHLMKKAEEIAAERGCRELSLEWDVLDSPQWVQQWYSRQGFNSSLISGPDHAWMTKKIG